MPVKPLRTLRFDHGRRRQAIVESLIADVLQGRLRAGQHLGTQELAQRHGVSHTPIREALIVLAGVGVIDLLPNRGAVVRKVTAADVREVCQVRRVLECEATQRACGRIDRLELTSLGTELRRLMRGARQSKPAFIARARSLDDRLHDLIAASCGNRFLGRELSRLKILFRAFRDMAWAYEEMRSDFRRLAGEAKEHLAIVDALLAENAREAARAMARHIRSGFKYWSRALPKTTIDPSAGVQAIAVSTRQNGSNEKHHKNGRR
jgi:DNA-binding GntR family transcriptional regulator